MRRIRRLLRGSSRGFTLVEVVIAIALIAIIGVGFLGGLSNAMWSLHIADVRTTAESLARSEMEYLKSMGYDADAEDYGPVERTGYEGYPVQVSFRDIDDGLQEITVVVGHHERAEIVTLAGYRADR